MEVRKHWIGLLSYRIVMIVFSFASSLLCRMWLMTSVTGSSGRSCLTPPPSPPHRLLSGTCTSHSTTHYVFKEGLPSVWNLSFLNKHSIVPQQCTVWTLAQEQICHRVPQRPSTHHLCDRRSDSFWDALCLWSDTSHWGQMGGCDWWEEISVIPTNRDPISTLIFSSTAGSSHILTPTNFLNDLKMLEQASS